MTRQRLRVLRRAGRATLDCAAVAGAACAIMLIVVGLFAVLAGDIVLAAGTWWIP